MNSALLEIRDLQTDLVVEGKQAPVVRGVNFTVDRGEVLGIVGESGSGKSVTARSLMRLLPQGAQIRGEVILDGVDVLTLSPKALRRARSTQMTMIFQDPRASINPIRTCGDQLREVLEVCRGVDKGESWERARALLEQVSIRDPERVLRAFPVELSGGMLQRILIAMALAPEPSLVIADEATTSLDVTVQEEILAILAGLREARKLGLIFITHDLELAAAICDRVAVMYAGQIVEEQPADRLFSDPLHPYTRLLLAARPDIGTRRLRLAAIPGRPPALGDLPNGCPFHPRCDVAIAECSTTPPPLRLVRPQGRAACHLLDDGGALEAQTLTSRGAVES